MRRLILAALLLGMTHLEAITYSKLSNLVMNKQINARVLKGEKDDESVLICCHGMGSDNRLIDVLRSTPAIKAHLVGFDFPDHGFSDSDNFAQSTFGTIEELIPLFMVLKSIVINGHVDTVGLYGFSAGGGAVVNAIAILNSDRYHERLEKIGIGKKERVAILKAIENGYVILDSPLKSIDEIILHRGSNMQFEVLKKRYQSNQMKPIDVLNQWAGLTLNVLLYLEEPDEVLSNRDDAMFIKRLTEVNKNGNNEIIVSSSEGHNGYHQSLWNAYPGFLKRVAKSEKEPLSNFPAEAPAQNRHK